jgi:hypothetical protein
MQLATVTTPVVVDSPVQKDSVPPELPVIEGVIVVA